MSRASWHRGRGLVLAALVIAFVGCKNSEPGTVTPVLPALVDPLPKPIFFAAHKGEHTLYLFGTIHVGAQPSVIPAWVLARLDAAPAFAMETDTSDPALARALDRTDGRSLDAELGADTWAKLEAAVGTAIAGRLRSMKVSAALVVLDMRGIARTEPMDPFLLARAQQGKKEIVYLEPALKQLALLDRWMDARSLRAALDAPDLQRAGTVKMLNAYAAGDTDALAALFRDTTMMAKAGWTPAEMAQYTKDLLDDRNASWVPALDAMVAKGDGFVAVGAGHLVGPAGVPSLLARDGFTVERMVAP